MNKEIYKREREVILRRAIIAANPEYFSWTEEEQEKYRGHRKWEDDFMFFRVIFKELFGFKAETQEELDEYYNELSIKDNLVLNQTILPMRGIGEDNFYLNESFGEGKSLLDFKTLYDYDYDDHCYQENARERDFEGYSKKPYRGSLYGTWASLEIDGNFTYASLSMLSSHILFGVVEDFAFEEINKIIPYKYVRGKNHGKKQKSGGYLWEQRVDAKGKEGQLDELKGRFWEYLSARFYKFSDSTNKKYPGKVYMIEKLDVDGDPYIDFLFSDMSLLKKIHFKSFVRDIRETMGDVQEVYHAIEKEKELARKFIHDAYKNVMENYDPKIVKFKKKRKVVIAEQAIKDFENLLD
jgi:hypothetical protein